MLTLKLFASVEIQMLRIVKITEIWTKFYVN